MFLKMSRHFFSHTFIEFKIRIQPAIEKHFDKGVVVSISYCSNMFFSTHSNSFSPHLCSPSHEKYLHNTSHPDKEYAGEIKHLKCLFDSCYIRGIAAVKVLQLAINSFINVPLCMDGQCANSAFSFRGLVWSGFT